MAPYVWTINGRTYDATVPLSVTAGQTTRLRVRNHSMMPHPLHLHGHTCHTGTEAGMKTRLDYST